MITLLRVVQAFAIGAGCYAGLLAKDYLAAENALLDFLSFTIVMLAVYFLISFVGSLIFKG